MFHKSVSRLLFNASISSNQCQLNAPSLLQQQSFLLCQTKTINSLKLASNQRRSLNTRRPVAHLTANKITEILSANEVRLLNQQVAPKHGFQLPGCVKAIECNQLAANNPIEDRIRVSMFQLPGCKEPTLILGVFDGHGGGMTVDLISRRLFNYIAVSLHQEPAQLQISTYDQLSNVVVDIFNSPKPYLDPYLQAVELDLLNDYKDGLSRGCKLTQTDIATNLKASFQRCDDDLSREIQEKLISPGSLKQPELRHYLSATVSGCCAIVLVVHDGFAYLASTGDCRAVFGAHKRLQAGNNYNDSGDAHQEDSKAESSSSTCATIELNDEHNCDNINEIRRLTASHPKSEQNTMIKHNRLLGHLMPFRAFGDYIYKWPADMIKACGVARAFGGGVIPANYETPPYLISEPDVKIVQISENSSEADDNQKQHLSSYVDYLSCSRLGNDTVKKDKYIIMASDGLWELFESSRDVVDAIVEHSTKTSQQSDSDEDIDVNCATHILRSALQFGPYQDIGIDRERLKKLHHIRLESTLTLPKSVVRNFRDDISIILLKLS